METNSKLIEGTNKCMTKCKFKPNNLQIVDTYIYKENITTVGDMVEF